MLIDQSILLRAFSVMEWNCYDLLVSMVFWEIKLERLFLIFHQFTVCKATVLLETVY
jgi:hypothetical protein